eukprot:4616680-Pleurochrysis_carterae.AAC.1
MPATRLCLDSVRTWDDIVTKSQDGHIVDGRSTYSLARQNGGDVTLWDLQLTLACYARLPFFILCRFCKDWSAGEAVAVPE